MTLPIDPHIKAIFDEIVSEYPRSARLQPTRLASTPPRLVSVTVENCAIVVVGWLAGDDELEPHAFGVAEVLDHAGRVQPLGTMVRLS